ncbi:unnamed protein product [Trifolium pratense]|uniref:Uncharacterized protein n=1 Tax=Trifolium pratense TaxID=57577 RepID=A0ACB0K475_TRIPR|nr:unnamed protein product [Trifolium pratense]
MIQSASILLDLSLNQLESSTKHKHPSQPPPPPTNESLVRVRKWSSERRSDGGRKVDFDQVVVSSHDKGWILI